MAEAARFERDLRAHGPLIDANLLVLLVVGAVNRERIAQFKRTRQYTPEDWDLLTGILEQAPRRFSVPHVLAEAGNLTDLRGPELLMARAALRQTIAILEETPVSSPRRLRRGVFAPGSDRRRYPGCGARVRLRRAHRRWPALRGAFGRRDVGREVRTPAGSSLNAGICRSAFVIALELRSRVTRAALVEPSRRPTLVSIFSCTLFPPTR
jgi:hypothetical protein